MANKRLLVLLKLHSIVKLTMRLPKMRPFPNWFIPKILLETHMFTLDSSVQKFEVKIHKLHTELLNVVTSVKDIALANQAIVQKKRRKCILKTSFMI